MDVSIENTNQVQVELQGSTLTHCWFIGPSLFE